MAVAVAERSEYVIHMTARQMVGVVIAGIVAGIAAWFCGWVFNSAIFHPLLCGDAALEQCSSAPVYSEVAALVLGTGAGVFGLVRLQIFRPLLVGLAVAVSLWGVLVHLMNSDAWMIGILIYAGLYALGYAFFAWVARIRSLLTATVIVVAVLILTRYLLNS